MPELPEVETIARDLAAQVQHRFIVGIEKLDWPRMLETPDLPTFQRFIAGRRIHNTARRAKWLLLLLDDAWTLAIHLRMSGRVGVYTPDVQADNHTHLVLRLDDERRIFFRDPRKFGRVRLLDPAGMAALDTRYGLEPLGDDFCVDALAQILADRRTRLKPLLLHQHLIAGMGNIYVDESLWYARLHPLRQANTLNSGEIGRLHTAIRTILQRAIQTGGSTLRDYRTGYGKIGQNQVFFSVYGRTGQPCPTCQNPVQKITVAQRGTHLCPHCQRVPEAETGAT
jgi:formamidopyrimidine-DNA glycosylase